MTENIDRNPALVLYFDSGEVEQCAGLRWQDKVRVLELRHEDSTEEEHGIWVGKEGRIHDISFVDVNTEDPLFDIWFYPECEIVSFARSELELCDDQSWEV